MRIIFILAVFCYAVYSCTMNLNGESTNFIKEYNKSSMVSPRNTTSDTSQKDTASVEAMTLAQGNTASDTLQKEELTDKQINNDQVKEDNNSKTEHKINDISDILLDKKTIATMTPEKLKNLISKGANVNAKNKKGTTVLMLYSASSSFDNIKILLDNGADINAANSQGGTALMGACQKNTKEVITLLLQRGAHQDARTTNGKTALDFLKTNNNLLHKDRMEVYDTIIKQMQQ